MNCSQTNGKIKMNCSQTEFEINTSNCTNTDAYAYGISIDIGWFNEWIVWEGGIAFNTVYWLLILLISLVILHILRRKFNCRLLTERLDGLEDRPPTLKQTNNWLDWLSFSIDEAAIGKDGATFLWFQYRLIQVELLRMALGIILIIIHFHGDKLGEWPDKTLRSTGLYNSGINGVHGVICSAILTVLAWLMKQHGQDRCIRSLASHDVNSASTIYNCRWLMITGLPLSTRVNSLLEYLMCTFESSFSVKGIHREQIVMAQDLSKLLPVVHQLDFIRNVKLQINGKANEGRTIQRRFWDLKFYFKKVTGYRHFLLQQKGRKSNNSNRQNHQQIGIYRNSFHPFRQSIRGQSD